LETRDHPGPEARSPEARSPEARSPEARSPEAGLELRRYLSLRDTLRYEGRREPGRSKESELRVLIRLEASGAPRAAEGETIFAFLPTREPSGLPWIVHARFDVTLDRERLELDSSWNQALLIRAGALAARGLLALSASLRNLETLLDVIPTEAELRPSMRPLGESLRAGLLAAACLPGADGEPLTPAGAHLLPAPLAAALAGVDLPGGGRALRSLGPRRAEAAAFLGARAFGDSELLELLRTSLRAGRPPPAFLDDRVLEALGGAAIPDAAIAALPLLRDAEGALLAAEGTLRASATLARLYRGLRPIVSEAMLQTLPSSLRRRLHLPPLEPAQLIEDLLDGALSRSLRSREAALLEALEALPREALEALRAAPLLRDRAGAWTSVEAGLSLLDPRLEPIAAALGARHPFVADDLARAHPLLLARWLPRFDLEALAGALEAGLELDGDALAPLLELLDTEAPRLGRELAQRFAAQALFLDRQGRRRPLLGSARALRGADTALEARLPEWPWLLERERAFPLAIGGAEIDARALSAALMGAHEPGQPPLPPVSEASLPGALEWLADRAEELPRERIARLAAASIWPDRGGGVRMLEALIRPGGSEDALALYASSGLRSLAHPASTRLADALGLEDRIPAAGLRSIVADLPRLEGVHALEPALLGGLLEEAARSLHASLLAPIAELRLFADEAGQLRALGSWDHPDPERCHRPGAFRPLLRGGALPLLDAAEEARLPCFLEVAAAPAAGPLELLERAQAEPRLLLDPIPLRQAILGAGASLSPRARALLEASPLFASAAGSWRRARELADPEPLRAALGEAELRALALDARLFAPNEARLARALGLEPEPPARLLEEALLPRLEAGAPLAQPPAPLSSPEALVALAELAQAAGLDPRAHPLALSLEGRLERAPLSPAEPETCALARVLGLGARIADPAWERRLGPALAESLLIPLPVRPLLEALRARCPEEAAREGHAILPDPAILYAFLETHREAIEADPVALGALGAACALPSARGTLRSPRSMLLDPSLPDLGLAWGLADDVPAPLAAWLAARFELGRRERRLIVEHILDGLDEASQRDDAARALELIRSLARAIGADRLDAEALEEAVRRFGVRARLRVPLRGGGWDKPRRALLPEAEDACGPGSLGSVESFCAAPPPQIRARSLDAPSRALLVAAGARAHLDEGKVLEYLKGQGLLEGADAARALARYVLRAALREPRLAEFWKLSERPWIPDAGGRLRRSRDLLLPDELALGLFRGADRASADRRFPDPEIIAGLDPEAAGRFGFQRAATLSLQALAALLEEKIADSPLLEWLEAGLEQSRFGPSELRAALAGRLWLRDARGRARRAEALAEEGAAELFGALRGDFPQARRYPRLARALGIRRRPDASMIREVLEELGEELGSEAGLRSVEPDALPELITRLTRCLGRLAQLKDGALPLAPGSAIPALIGSRATLLRIGDPRLWWLEPGALAEALPAQALALIAEPSWPLDGQEALGRLLLSSGVPDLWSAFRPSEVLAGPERDDLRESAEALGQGLRRALGAAAGERIRIVETLSVRGELRLDAIAGPGAGISFEGQTEADAAILDGTLLLTPAALEDPGALAPTLAPAAARREAMREWLERGEWRRGGSSAAPPLAMAAEAEAKRSSGSSIPGGVGTGLLGRLRHWLGGDDGPPPAPAGPLGRARAREAAPEALSRRSRDAAFFRPKGELGTQLEGTEGWMDSRLERPEYGFAFTPPRLPPPWLYAPSLLGVRFDRRRQQWRSAPLPIPQWRGPAGQLSLRGRLPAGEVILPIPHGARLEEVHLDRGSSRPISLGGGIQALRLDAEVELRLRVGLGRVPSLEAARPAPFEEALQSFIDPAELPEEALEFALGLLEEPSLLERALGVRDFVRRRYRYDPSYLEDPALGRWLARLTRARSNAHVAALHAASD
ncbi:MAG: hypothetical protein OEY14_03830, partial [Myxococcales bacterium]|nr:hypothetical protein [Myxococcales bacterium]